MHIGGIKNGRHLAENLMRPPSSAHYALPRSDLSAHLRSAIEYIPHAHIFIFYPWCQEVICGCLTPFLQREQQDYCGESQHYGQLSGPANQLINWRAVFVEELSPLGTMVTEEREQNALRCSSACRCSEGDIKQGHRVQLLPSVCSWRHIHKYVPTEEVQGQIGTHTHIWEQLKGTLSEIQNEMQRRKQKSKTRERARHEKNLDVSEGEFNITKEQR